ncbi:hypothetical protein F5Y17DRAFT_470367 [Xylariaceae sp. FL0594]|nr:hypothetical protein F5Y17DRAFT_470367 [Xylariaceae sp. FL0594]
MATITSNGSQHGRGSPVSKPISFDFAFQKKVAGLTEDRVPKVNEMVSRMRQADDAIFARNGLSAGDHFFHIADHVEETRLFHVARMMPKGAHLHIHFNSMLLPEILLGYAKGMDNMYVWSDYKLTTPEAFEKCRLEFRLFENDKVRQNMEKRACDVAKVRKGIMTQEENLEIKRRLAALESAKQLKDKDAKHDAYDALGPNIFSKHYNALDIADERAASTKKTRASGEGIRSLIQNSKEMRYQYFRKLWETHNQGQGDLDEWLVKKITFSQEDVATFFTEQQGDLDRYFPKQNPSTPKGGSPTEAEALDWPEDIRNRVRNSDLVSSRISARKAWTAFNGRTKMMKGLFNYESAFRRYTRKCLEEFVKDNVQYAEIRPNFMPTNQIYDDEGKNQIDNFGTMRCIIGEYEQFMQDIGDMDSDGNIIVDPQHRPTFSGLKVIYCTPRSFSKDQVRGALGQCIEMKQQWPQYIAGFDLVGEEAYAEKFPLSHFVEEFKDFKERCEELELNIPFLFHCGETPDDLEGNLNTALELGSKRIGHGYALPKKPDVLEGMKRNNVCVETCPISNMVLGLAKRMEEHNMYTLLDKELHCAVSSDNGTLFKSTLSHDFFEVMAGHRGINLYGWIQLARWSIEHSCLSEAERKRMLPEWERRWREFVDALAEASTSGVADTKTKMNILPSTKELVAARGKAERSRLEKLSLAQRLYAARCVAKE